MSFTDATTVEISGATRLVGVGNQFFMRDSSGAGPSLKFGGAAVVGGEFGAWAPIGAEQTASGYDVAWKLTGADQYTVWGTDSNGNVVSNLAGGIVSGTSAALESVETSFHQDLNGDGTIGVPAGGGGTSTTIESFGSTSLVLSGGHYFMNPVSSGTGPELSYQGAPVTQGEFGAWTPLGAEAAQLYQLFAAAGRSEEDFSGIINFLRGLA